MNIFKMFKRSVKNIFKRKKKKHSKTSEIKCYIHDLSSYIEGSLDVLEKMRNESETREDNRDAEITGLMSKNFNMDEAGKYNLENTHFLKGTRSSFSANNQNLDSQKQECLIPDVLKYGPIDEIKNRESEIKSNDNSSFQEFIIDYEIKENNEGILIPSFGSHHSARNVDHDTYLNKIISTDIPLKHQQYFPANQNIGHFEDSSCNNEKENRGIKSRSKFSQNSSIIKDPSLCKVEYIDTLASNEYSIPLKKASSSINLISDKHSERNDYDGEDLDDKSKKSFNYTKSHIPRFETESIVKTSSQQSFRWGKDSLKENMYEGQSWQRFGNNETREEIATNYYDKYCEGFTDDNNSPETYSSSLHQCQNTVDNVVMGIPKEKFNISHSASASDFGMKDHCKYDMKIFLNDKHGAYSRLLSTFGANRDSLKPENETFYSQYPQKSSFKVIKNSIHIPDGMNSKDDKDTMNVIKRQLGLDIENSEENDIKIEKLTLIDLTDKVQEVCANIECIFKDQRTLSAPILKLASGMNKFKAEKTMVKDYTDRKFYTKVELVSVCDTQDPEVSPQQIKLEEDEESVNELIDSTLNELMEKLLKIQSSKKMHKQVENVVEEALVKKYSSIFCDKDAAKEVIQDMIKKANVRKEKSDSSID